MDKIPVLGDIPWLGKLFQSKITSKNNTELIVLVTPEIVQPIPVGVAPPELSMPKTFMKDVPTVAPRTPGMDVTGTKAPVQFPPILLEELREIQRKEREPGPTNKQSTPAVEFVPTPVNSPTVPPTAPAATQPGPGAELVPAPSNEFADAGVEFVPASIAPTLDNRSVDALMEFTSTPIHSPALPPVAGQGLFPARRGELADARPAAGVPGHSLHLDSLHVDSLHVDSPRFLHAVKGGIERAFSHLQHLAGVIAHGRHDRASVQARTAREDLQGPNVASALARPADSDIDSGGR